VYKGDFKYEDSKRDMVLLLGKEHFFEIDGEEEIEYLEELPNPKSYLTLDSAEEIPGQNEKFVIHVGARPAIHLEGEELDVVEAVVVLNSLIRDAWQKACESAFILGREVYQFHAIVRKVNRRKKTQDRILVVSNQWIYNMEMFGEEGPQEEFKWSLPIGSLLRVAAGKDDSKLGEFPATIHFDLVVAKQLLAQNAYKDRKLGTKGSSVNDKHQLLFISQYARDRCTMALVALYYSQSKKRLAFTRGNEATGIRRSQLGVCIRTPLATHNDGCGDDRFIIFTFVSLLVLCCQFFLRILFLDNGRGCSSTLLLHFCFFLSKLRLSPPPPPL